MSREIDHLQPAVARMCREFIFLCAEAGIDVIITATRRTMEEQAALYAQGRTKSGPRVTNAAPGQSWHNWGCAFDFVPIKNGKADWNNIMTFGKCGKIAESVGLEWGGRWRCCPMRPALMRSPPISPEWRGWSRPGSPLLRRAMGRMAMSISSPACSHRAKVFPKTR